MLSAWGLKLPAEHLRLVNQSDLRRLIGSRGVHDAIWPRRGQWISQRCTGNYYATLAAAQTEAIGSVENVRLHIAETLSKITGAPSNAIFEGLRRDPQANCDFRIPVSRIVVEDRPATAQHGREWVAQFPGSQFLEPPEFIKNHFEFKLRADLLTKLTVRKVLSEKEHFGTHIEFGLRDPNNPSLGRKKALIEFSSPNIAKPFHAGHLRSTVIGGFLANIYEAVGWDVIRYNYLGDWGRQFGLLAVGFHRYGSKEKLASDPIGHLYDIYVHVNAVAEAEERSLNAKKAVVESLQEDDPERDQMQSELVEMEANSTFEDARAYLQRLEEGDPEAISIWKEFRDLSIKKYKKTYARLNIRYDHYAGESGVKESSILKVINELQVRDLCGNSSGALLVDFTKMEEQKRLGKAIVRKANGSSIYLSRDIGAAIQRHEEFRFDKMLYVVASQQDIHMAQVIKLIELVGREDIALKTAHVSFGMVRGMSTRKGTAKFLDDILDEASEKMYNVMATKDRYFTDISQPEKTAEQLGISAVVVQDMKAKRLRDYDFNIDRMTSIEGDTGPFLQYTHARLCSISRRAGPTTNDLECIDWSLLKEPAATDIARAVSLWPSIVITAYRNHEPSTILNYLFSLAHTIGSSYRELRVLNSEPELRKARLALYESARQVLTNGLKMLGLTPLDR